MTMPGRDKRNIVVDVTITSNERGAEKAAAGLEKVDKSAEGAGDSLRGMGDDAKILNAEIERTTARIKELDRELANVGNDRDVRKRLRAEESYLRDLRRVESRLSPSLPEVRPGFGRSDIIEAPKIPIPSGHGAMVAVVVGAVAAAMPTVGAMVAGAVSGAIGTGGVVGGVLMASRDPRVKGAFKGFADDIGDEFFRGSDTFVGPVIRSMDIIKDAFKDMHVPEAFAKMAPFIEVIAGGLGDLGRNIMPGLNKAFDRMGPFAAVAAQGFAEMGESIGKFMEDVTKSDGAVMGLETLFDFVNGLFVVTGKVTRALSEMYEDWIEVQKVIYSGLTGIGEAMGIEWLTAASATLAKHFSEMRDISPSVGTAILDVANNWDEYANSVEAATVETTNFGQALSDVHHQFLDWKRAEIGVEEALDRLAESFRENGKNLDVDTEKGRENLTMLERFAREAENAATKKLEETHSVEQANAVYDQYKQRLIETLDALGFTRKEAKKLADEWMGLAKLPPVVLEAHIKYKEINQPPRFLASGDVQVYGGRHLAGGERGFAGGGTTPAFEPYRVHRDETIWSDRQHYVATAAQTKALSASGGAAVMGLRVMSGGSDLFEQFMAQFIAKFVRVEGADSLGLAPA